MSIKTRERVTEFGEVFTSEREVNAMLEMVQCETQRIDSRFLEPACGDGNFLAEILERKVRVVEQRYRHIQIDYERYCFLAVASIYGVDILQDNVLACRDRLYRIATDGYQRIFKEQASSRFTSTVQYVLSCNILWGDALSMMVPSSNTPIVFSEWSITTGSIVKRTDYTLATLLAYQPMDSETLFSDLGQEAFIPTPVRSYPQVHLLEIDHVE